MQKRHDTIIAGGIKILQSEEAFCYSTDTLLLLDFINANYRFPPVLKMAELGSGTGGLCIAAAYQNPGARVTGIELQPKLNELARESAHLNSLENIEFKDADLREIKRHFYPETFNLAAANPPYFKLGTGRVNRNSNKAQAKHEIKCTLDDVFAAAAYLLKKTGEFFLIHHYSRIFDVFSTAARYKFKLICFQPVYIERSAPGENASHCLFAFGRAYKKEPAVLAPRYIRGA
jgi:tRNA1Val (adenine37-N6)-methyltransferase